MNEREQFHREKLLLARLLGPADPEVTCEQCFEQLDRYVELRLAGAEADTALPGLRVHLVGCPACQEDFDSLFSFLNSFER